ncbi:MAG: hypothetical protein IR153_04000 [Flavobacterium sp.]|nr:hypothetical protein [Flavobacterium sp.]
MDSNYIINRLKSTPYKFPTAEVLRKRLQNLEADKRQQVVSHLKIELCRECNIDIFEPLSEVVYRLPAA